MNKTLQEGVALAAELKGVLTGVTPNCDVIIGTPYIHLATVAELVKGSVINVAAQNSANKESGAYTGEISPAMVKSTGANYVILGHSERRAYYGETFDILKEKVLLALKNDLKPIFCIGELKEEREAGKQNEVVKAQMEGSVFNLSADDFAKIVLAYEPVWAIGVNGVPAPADYVKARHASIRRILGELFLLTEIPVLYGGSVNPQNAEELIVQPNVDGLFTGRAAWDAENFNALIRQVLPLWQRKQA